MKIDPQKLASFGYLPKELPPVFTSESLGKCLSTMILPQLATTKCVEFSIPKGKYARRILQIPNPFNFIYLAKHLSHPQHWLLMRTHNNKCQYSMSFVKENDKIAAAISNDDARAIKYRYPSFRRAKLPAILASFDQLFVVKIDISRYYPSIYTHTLTWALLGRSRAKEFLKLKRPKQKLEPDFDAFDFADRLDKIIRSGQENQSVGLPMGPDTSHIISEIIGCYFDQRLNARFPDLHAFRYFDDYEIFVDTEERAQEVLRFTQEILAEFQLSISENKVSIKRFPFEFEEAWVKEINRVRPKPANESNIRQYFSNIFGLFEKYPEKTSTMVKYALRAFERRTTLVEKKNWPIFEALLLKTALVAPSSLEIVSRILESYRSWVNRDKVLKAMDKLVAYHATLNHHLEIVWALWIMKQFCRVLPARHVASLVHSSNPFVLLLMLDLESKGLIEGGKIESSLKTQIADALNSNEDQADWLLYYEAVEVKKWISAKKRQGFKPLRDGKVSFYDPAAVIKTYLVEEDVKNAVPPKIELHASLSPEDAN
jgi:hypothetical protein